MRSSGPSSQFPGGAPHSPAEGFAAEKVGDVGNGTGAEEVVEPEVDEVEGAVVVVEESDGARVRFFPFPQGALFAIAFVRFSKNDARDERAHPWRVCRERCRAETSFGIAAYGLLLVLVATILWEGALVIASRIEHRPAYVAKSLHAIQV